MGETWNLDRLGVFVTAVKEGSLTRTGGVLGLAQPAVSRHISLLEAQCGARLFHRTGRGVRLTEFGERLLPQIEQVLENAARLDTIVAETAEGPIGEVRIGALPSLYATLIVPLFRVLRDQTPGIRLRIFEGSAGQIDQWLTDGYVDIGLPYRYSDDPQDFTILLNVSSCLLCAADSRIAGQRTIRFKDLDGLPLILPGRPSKARAVLDRHARAHGIRLNVVMEADSMQIQKIVPVLGREYTILPKHVAADEIRAGQLAAVKIVEPEIERSVVMEFTSARPASRAVRETASRLRKIVSDPKRRVPG